MSDKSSSIKLIGYGLSAVYGLGLLIYLAMYVLSFFDPQSVLRSPFYSGKFSGIETFQKYAVMFWALYFPQFVGFLAVAKRKEWGRKLVVAMNAIMCLYVVYDMIFVVQIFQPIGIAGLAISLAIVLFFTNLDIAVKFQGAVQSRHMSILVVDDDRTLLRMVKATLLKNGFDVFVSTTGEKGLKIAMKRRPQLIILDVILPRMKGREVCARLKEDGRTQKIPVIFLTAKDSPDDIRAEMEVGGATHLTKPIEPQRLLAEINKILE